jgi:hypothetical protein
MDSKNSVYGIMGIAASDESFLISNPFQPIPVYLKKHWHLKI